MKAKWEQNEGLYETRGELVVRCTMQGKEEKPWKGGLKNVAQTLRQDAIFTVPPFLPLPLIITLCLPFSLHSMCQASDRMLAVVKSICVCEEREEGHIFASLSNADNYTSICQPVWWKRRNGH